MFPAFQDKLTELGAGAATPVPDTAKVFSPFEASLLMVMLPATSPAAAGSKLTFRVAVCDGARISPLDNPLTFRPAPERITFEMVTFEPPTFDTVMVFEALLPTFSFPKAMLAGLIVSCPGVTTGATGVVTGAEVVTGALTGAVVEVLEGTLPPTGVSNTDYVLYWLEFWCLLFTGGGDIGPFAYYLQGIVGTSLLKLIVLAVGFGLLYAFARRRIDVNLFSLGALNADWLTRAYVAASLPVAAWRRRWALPRDQRVITGAHRALGSSRGTGTRSRQFSLSGRGRLVRRSRASRPVHRAKDR